MKELESFRGHRKDVTGMEFLLHQRSLTLLGALHTNFVLFVSDPKTATYFDMEPWDLECFRMHSLIKISALCASICFS